MTQDQMQASIARHARYLTPDQCSAHMPTEDELIALDRSINVQKNSGVYDRLRDHFALRDQMREVRA